MHVRRFVADMAEHGAAPGTIRNAYRLVHMLLGGAVHAGLIRANPASGSDSRSRNGPRWCSSPHPHLPAGRRGGGALWLPRHLRRLHGPACRRDRRTPPGSRRPRPACARRRGDNRRSGRPSRQRTDEDPSTPHPVGRSRSSSRRSSRSVWRSARSILRRWSSPRPTADRSATATSTAATSVPVSPGRDSRRCGSTTCVTAPRRCSLRRGLIQRPSPRCSVTRPSPSRSIATVTSSRASPRSSPPASTSSTVMHSTSSSRPEHSRQVLPRRIRRQ